MPVSQVTNEFMRRLPAGLRPNPWNIDEEVMAAAAKGWSITDLAQAVMADNPRQPGHVVAFLRRVQDQPAPMGPLDSKPVGHHMCTSPQHPENCQICWCHGREQHMIPIPMPPDIKTQLQETFRGFGRVPND